MSTTPFLVFLLLPWLPFSTPNPISSCPPVSCGGTFTDIYPFRLSSTPYTTSTSYCGYPDLELVCINGKLTKQTSSINYTILSINQTARTVSMVDTDLLASSCPIPSHNLTYDQTHPLYYASGVVNFTFYFNCSSDLRGFIPCLQYDFRGKSYLVPPGDRYALYVQILDGKCERIVEVPSLDAVSTGFEEIIKKGFQLTWDHPQEPCGSCEKSGGRCMFTEDSSFLCVCADGAHPDYCKDADKKSKKGLKIGIAIGGVFLGLALALGGFLFWRHRKNKERAPSLSSLFGSISSHGSSISKDPESLPGSYYKTPIFSYKELEEATGGFDSANELGDGGFGVVFKGKLKDGRIVAVKRLYERNHRRVKQFRNEVEILNRLRHHNLVTLYGCTSAHESKDLVLVYEYIPNGTVADHLHGSLAAEHALTWHIRMSIAIETADALSYLHAHQPQIIHRDVKTSNILLDNNYTVKVADFGLSRLFPLDVTHVSTAPQGTPGYVDPEYHQCYQLTDKSDVYSFGVVLVELISSKAAVDVSRHRSEINLSNMAMDKIPKGLVGELVDPMLGFDEDPVVRRMVQQVADVAFKCLQPARDERPSMDEVREMLKDIACMDEGGPPVGEKHMRENARLLKFTHPNSPKSVADNWVSRSTTPNASA